MTGLPHQCAICAELIDEGPNDRHLVASIVRAGAEVPMDEYYFHRPCLAAALNPSVPLGEVLEPD